MVHERPQQRLSNISDTLLVSLRNKRDRQATGRPLIFIGHSFGGNLIEQAIVSASRQSGYLEIAESTVGVVFLGTPHRGSAAASWGVLITSLAPPQLTAENRILKDLEEQSSSLTDRLHDFSRWLFVESVPVVCFFEQLATDYSSRMGAVGKIIPSRELVVPETSACIDGHPKISLHADHFKINKFYGPDDPSFKLVYPEIKRMAQGAQDILNHRRNPKTIPMDQSATSGDIRTCLQEMRVTNPRDILSDIRSQKGKRIGHTCEWILKREEFSAWGTNDNSQLLRLIGSPGIGKTMMSTFLIEVLKGKVEKSPDKMFAYFLCDYRYPEQRSPTAILRSLIWQLLLQRNGLFQHMRPDFEKHKDSRLFECLFENFSALWRIFHDMLQDEHAGEVFILIDALDECDKSTRKALLRFTRELFQASPKSAGNFKFLVTCRPEIGDIEFELDGISVPLKMDSREVNTDLSDYINLKCEDLAQRKEYSQSLKEDVKEALESRAGGTFLWVSLMINELESTPKYEVANKLKDLPAGLDETYTRILDDNIPKKRREDARFLLLSMVAARRPLTKKELAASFAFWKTGSVVGDHDLHDYMDICASCSSIIYLDIASNDSETTANFCHQSVKDFLLNDHGSLSGAWYQTSWDGANLHMFQMCWRYLSSDVFVHGSLVIRRRNDMLLKTPMEELQIHWHQYSFLEYASSDWEEHAIASCPAILKDFQIDIVKAPTLRDAWLLRAAREGQGQEAIVKLLLTTGAVDVNSKDAHGQTPLSLAAASGHEATVKLLLATEKVEVDSKDNDGQTPLSLAAENGHEATVQLLLATEKVEVDSKDVCGNTPLSLAASYGYEAVVKLLLATEKVDVDAMDDSGWTPLLWAAENGYKDIIELLLQAPKLGMDSEDDNGNTPLSLAASYGHEATVKLLLATEKVEVDSKNKYGQTPLSWAAENGHEATVKLLLATEKVDVDAMDDNGNTPLSLAASYGHEATVKLLLATEKVEVDSKNKYGQTPLSWAAENGHEATVKLLLAIEKVDVDSKDNDGQTPLSLAAANGREATIKLLLATEKVEVNSKDVYGRTPLSWAAVNGREATVKLLLAIEKVDVNSKDVYGRTPLSWAAENGHEATVKLLLATEKVEVDSKDVCGNTPLSLAASYGYETTVKLLLATEKVEVDSEDVYGRTPLSWAAENGHEATVKLLLATEKVDVDSKDNYGQAPLLVAAANGHEAIVKLLLATEKVDVDSKDNYGQAPLLVAAANGHEAIVKLLLTTEAVDVNSKDVYGRTPLSWAAENGHDPIVKLLFAKCSAKTEDNIGRTPLSFAAKNGHDTIVMVLLSHETVDPDQQDHYGSTPLSIAVRNCRLQIVKALLATGEVTFNSQDRFGRTLWWWARRSRNTDIQQALRDYAEKRGIAICGNDDFSEASPISNYRPSRWCDVCTLSIPQNEVFYECEVCNNGDFDICSACYMVGGRCLGDDHELAQRKDKEE
ncbi:Ankyrin repeat domain-containing protein 50 [Fusarium oxysporum f. sp. raphani]|uniref:Ankyrin repeat domain-containing protein 50 n=1 Tax=Fusarium oxysporum f. sp. raphani TaxID=96318 RepID=A0A8J5Q2E6_FUSOX|nr:Ankyrin repeat domain-containing protein 50 [Fusarium oxysporum f. sp. raphani]